MSDTERRILQAVLDCGSDAYTPNVWERIGGVAGSLRGPAIFQVGLRLWEMEERGWVDSAAGAATPERGMRPKRRWWLTAEGRREMGEPCAPKP